MTQPFDPLALRIGAAYRRGLAAYVEAGKILLEKKATLKHGEWLPWLAKNAEALGFNTDRTAQYLMKSARENPKLASDMTNPLEISRRLWGHLKNNEEPAEPWRNINRYNKNDECYTPIPIIGDVRKVLGQIDLDAASSTEAQVRIKAKRFYSKDDDALTKEWSGRVFLNPPYSDPKKFVEKFIAGLEAGRIKEGITLTLNKTETQYGQMLGKRADAICFWRRPIMFRKPNGIAPDQWCGYWGHMLCYFGPNKEKFAKVFGKNGFIR